MNTTLDFELSLLLKEKGYDEWTTTWHQRGEGVVGCVEGRRDYYNRKGEVYTSAPTIAEVCMWLYEKHGIWIYVGCRGLEGQEEKTVFIPNGRFVPAKTKNGFEIDPILYGPKNTPKEAYESGIEYTLKNLIS